MKPSNRMSAKVSSPAWRHLQSEFLNWATDVSWELMQTIARHHHAVLPEETIETLQGELHKLKGACGLAGYPEIARSADEIGSALSQPGLVDDAWRKSRALHQMVTSLLEAGEHAETVVPRESGALRGKETRRIQGAASEGARVLAVCASATILHMIEHSLDSLSCSVQTATGAEEAFRMVRQMTPDVILICSSLTNEVGVNLARRIARYEKDFAAKIIFLTAGGMDDTRGLHESIEVVCIDSQGRSRILDAVERRCRGGDMTAAS